MAFKRADRSPTWAALIDAAKFGCGFIMLPRKEYVLVDEDVMELEGGVAWCRIPSGYVMRHTPSGDEWLHKIVAQHDGMVDHKDRNKLNCQRANLRPCTLSQNMANSLKDLSVENLYVQRSAF